MQFNLESTSQELLDWLYDHGAATRHISVLEFGEEKGLSDDELEDVLLDDLKRQGWIEGRTAFGPPTARLTTPGLRHVQQLRRPAGTAEGSPASTQQGPGRPGSTVYNIINNQGPISLHGSNFSQSVSYGLDTNAVLEFVQRLQQLLPEVQGLTEDDQAALKVHAAEIEAEVVKDEPNVGKIRKWMNDILRRLTEATAQAAVNSTTDQLIALAHEIMKAKGLSA